MRRNFKYIFASIPLINYEDYKSVNDYKKCNYDVVKMLQDKEFVAEIIKSKRFNYSDILTCYDKQKLLSLANSKTPTIGEKQKLLSLANSKTPSTEDLEELVEYIGTLTDKIDIDVSNIICSKIGQFATYSGYELYLIEKIIKLCPNIKNDKRVHKYFDNFIHSYDKSMFTNCFDYPFLCEYVIDKCNDLIKNGETCKISNLIKFMRGHQFHSLLNKNFDFIDVDFIMDYYDYIPSTIKDLVNYKFTKCQSASEKNNFVKKYKDFMDINTIVNTSIDTNDVDLLLSLTNDYIVKQLFKNKNKNEIFKCLTYEATEKMLEEVDTSYCVKEYGYKGCSCSASMGELIYCNHDPPTIELERVYWTKRENPDHKSNKHSLLCWMLLKNNNLDMVMQIINKTNDVNDIYNVLVYIYLNYSYDEFTNFVIKTGNYTHSSCKKMSSELGNLKYKKLFIRNRTAKNEFTKTFDI
jgi:hypothetical protein